MLCQVGQLASSKSAMKVDAPQLSALITILRSVGPVISTRRSSMSFGCGPTTPVGFADLLRFGEEVGLRAGVEFLLPLRAPREKLLAAGFELAVELCNEAQRLRAQDLGELLADRAGDRDALGKRPGHVHSRHSITRCGTAT